MSILASVTDHHFETEVLQSQIPVLVDFWAEWCGPCKNLMPTIEAIAESYAGKIKVFKLNVDDSPQTAAKYGVRGIPTLILFKNGQPVGTSVGALTRTKLDEFLNTYL